MSRRTLLRASARYGWLVALGGALAWLSSRSRSPETCPADNLRAAYPPFTNNALPTDKLTNAPANPEPSADNPSS